MPIEVIYLCLAFVSGIKHVNGRCVVVAYRQTHHPYVLHSTALQICAEGSHLHVFHVLLRGQIAHTPELVVVDDVTVLRQCLRRCETPH